MTIQYIILAVIGILVGSYILYKLYQMLLGKGDDDGCSSSSCKGCQHK